MNVDKWFEKQELVVKIILIVIPFVGWIMEILIRISAYSKNQNNTDLILLVLFLLLGWTYIPLIIDVIYLVNKGHIFLAEDAKEVINSDDKETVDAQPKKEEEEKK